MAADIDDELTSVASRQDFVRVVNSLVTDLERNPDGWENHTLPRFLEALSGWAQDCDGYYRNICSSLNPDEPQWRLFADMLLAARVYE